MTENQTGQDLSRGTAKLKHYVYDYVVPDSEVERRFVRIWIRAVRSWSTLSFKSLFLAIKLS